MKTKNLLVEISADELKMEGLKLSEKVEELENVQDEKKRITQSYAAEIKMLSREILHRAGIVKTGQDYRAVAVEELFNTQSKQVTVIRSDTGEVVEIRAMTSEELQQQLFPEHIGEN